ncbi:MAG TPA: HAD-IIB family hydrolase [Gammaproteobacteria bacterium]
MYFLALATDYDGTLAHGGVVAADTRAALRRLKDTGRRLILVTGRELGDLERVCRDVDVFDRIVAENGAVLFDPSAGVERVLAERPPELFIERLRARRIEPLSVGRVIVATWEPEEKTVLDVIRELGLELQIVFNKGAVMVLPAGVNKATGLAAALDDLRISAHNVIGVGDAENDHAFMRACGASAAVANALPMLKAEADHVLGAAHGAGVVELIERMIADDSTLVPERHAIAVGTAADGRDVVLEPHGGSVLIAGTSGVGKSRLATALTERMAERGFEFCVLDPEGDYDELEHAVTIGDAQTAPQTDEALKLLEQRGTNVVINTQCFATEERPEYFAALLPKIAALRARTGRPHWLLIDEAHHLLPANRADLPVVLPDALPAIVLVTVHPEAVSASALEKVGTVIAVGAQAADAIRAFCEATGRAAPASLPAPGPDEVVLLDVRRGAAPQIVKAWVPRQAHRRHTLKYAEGRLGEDRSFYFRGPDGRLNLRAHNLMLFVELAAGVDDDTWEHHRRAGDYSAWFRDAIKDDALAREAAKIEADDALDARASREKIAAAVRRRYTVPAEGAEH